MASSRTLINGTGYDIKSGRTLINGTGYDIKKGRTLINGTGYDIKFGTPVGELDVGASVYMNVDGTRREFIVVHQGNPDTTKYDASCNGTWVLQKQLAYVTAGTTQYATSEAFTYQNGTYINSLDTGIQMLIKAVKIPYMTVGSYGSRGYPTGADGLSAKVFSPSYAELGGTADSTTVYNGEDVGAKLDYFISGNMASTEAAWRRQMENSNGDHMGYWLRHPQGSGNPPNYLAITSAGIAEDGLFTGSYYWPMMFILPSDDAYVDDEFNVVVPTIKTITLTNLVADEGRGWISWGGAFNCTRQGSSATPGDGATGSCRIVPSAAGECTITFTKKTPALVSSHKYYVSFKVRYESAANCSFDFYWPIAEPVAAHLTVNAEADVWTRTSAVFTRESFTDGSYQCRFDYNNEAESIPVRYTSLMLFDLTEAFGVGCEPSKEWLDEHITTFGDSLSLTYI